MRIERTFDMELVKAVLTHPAIYPHITDDGCPPIDEFEPADHPSFYRLAVYDGEDVAGLFLFHPANMVCYEGHICLLPAHQGGDTRAAAKSALAWMFENTPCQKIMARVPAKNLPARRAVERAGMLEEGKLRKSLLKDGVLQDQILYGVEKGETWKQ